MWVCEGASASGLVCGSALRARQPFRAMLCVLCMGCNRPGQAFPRTGILGRGWQWLGQQSGSWGVGQWLGWRAAARPAHHHVNTHPPTTRLLHNPGVHRQHQYRYLRLLTVCAL